MDEAVVKYYRRMMRGQFEHVGSLENPAIFLDSLGEDIGICGAIEGSYLHLYIEVADDTIKDFKYLCTCDPVANVAVDILCILVKGKSLDEAQAITEDSFLEILGGPSAELAKRANGLLELLRRGIIRYQEQLGLSSQG